MAKKKSRQRRAATVQKEAPENLEALRTELKLVPPSPVSPTPGKGVSDLLNQSFSDKDRNFFIERMKDLSTKLKQAESRVEELLGQASNNEGTEALEQELAEKEKIVEQRTNEIATLKKQREKLIKSRDDLHNKLELSQQQLKEKEDEIETLNLPRADSDDATKNLISENLKKVKELKSTNNKLQDEVLNLQQYIEKQSEKLTKLEEGDKENTNELENLRALNQKLNEDILLFSKTREHALDEHSQEIDTLKLELSSIKVEREGLNEELNEASQRNKDQKTKLSQLSNELQATKDALKEVKKQLQNKSSTSSAPSGPTNNEQAKTEAMLRNIIQEQESKIKELTINISVRPDKIKSASSSPTSHISPSLGSDQPDTPQHSSQLIKEEELQNLHLSIAEQKLVNLGAKPR
ncbi:Lama2 [Acrasis kona]|uniref:Lama2 n=1 Tax=Acrasis kona TaxID=1008807 RepID=A0AAW2ZIX9_9EUKA